MCKRCSTFADLSRLTRWLSFSLLLCALAFMAAALVDVLLVYNLAQMKNLGFEQPDLWRNVEKLTSYSQSAGLVRNLFLLFSAGFSLVWIHRALTNACLLSGNRGPWGPARVLSSFLIPVYNLYAPFSVMKQIWVSSSPISKADTAKRPTILNLWWVMYLLCAALILLQHRVTGLTMTPDEMVIKYAVGSMVSLGFFMLCLVFRSLVLKVEDSQSLAHQEHTPDEALVTLNSC